MTYKDYIELGFKRVDYEDSILTDKTGYKPFELEYRLNKYAKIKVTSDNLNRAILKVKNIFTYYTNTDYIFWIELNTKENLEDLIKSIINSYEYREENN